MNISYRSLWNPTLGIWVAVSEIAHARGKRSGDSGDQGVAATHPSRRNPLALAIATMFAVVALPASASQDVNIITGGSGSLSGGVFSAPSNNSTIGSGVVAGALTAGTSVSIFTGTTGAQNGDIRLTNGIQAVGAGSLYLQAAGSILLNNNISAAAGGGNPLNVNLWTNYGGAAGAPAYTSNAAACASCAVVIGSTGNASISTAGGSVNIQTNGGALVLGTGANTGSINTAGGALDIYTTGISQLGTGANTITAGVTTLHAGTGAISLTNSGNDFTGAVTAIGAGVAITDANDLNIAVVANSGNNAVSLIAGGTLTLSANAINAGTANLTLASNGGSLSTNGSLSGGNVNLTAQSGITLGNDVTAGGSLVLTTSQGQIFQTGGSLNVAQQSAIDAGISDILLTSAGNSFGGTVSLSGANTQITASGALSLGTVDVTSLTATATGGIKLNNDIYTHGAQTYNNAVTLGGTTTLTSTGASAINFASTVDGAHSLTVNTAGLTTFGGPVGSFTALTSLTTGTGGSTTLNGNVTTTGAQTFNNAVTLSADTTLLSMGGSAIQLNGSVNALHNLTVDSTSVGSRISGDISGSGSLTQTSGTLTLTGTNSYTGGTTVNGGVLQGNSSSLQGNILLDSNSSVIFAQGTSGTYAGVLSGDGSLIKNGIGNLILSGTNNLSGTTAVNGGTLSVNGSLANSAVTVNSGGTLGGSGTVGNATIAAGGVLAPGNSIGTLNVAGNLNFAAGSTYRVEVNAAGNNDHTNVTGTVNLNGATVDVQASAGTYAANTTYIILHATGGLSGAFSNVTSNLAFLMPMLSYDVVTNNVSLYLMRNNISYSNVAITANQIATSTSLQSMSGATGDLANVMTAVTGLSAEQARASYDAMSGASLSAMSRAGAGFSAGVGSQMRARLAAVGGSSTSAYAFGTPVQLSGKDHVYDLFSTTPTASQSSSASSSLIGLGASADSSLNNYGRGFWLRGYGNYQSTSSDGNGVASTVRSNGLSVGFDTEVSEGLIVGVAGTFGKSSLRFDSNDTGRSRDRAIAAYASYKTGPWNFNGSANFAFNSSNMARQIVVGALTRTATSSFDGHTASTYGEATYDIQMQDWMLQPLAALSLSRSKTDGFTEQGAGALNLQVAGQTTNSVKTLFGAKAQFEVGQVKLEPRLAWGHEFGDANAPMTMQFAGSAAPSFLVSGVKLPRNSVIAGLGLSSNISKNSNSNLSLFADVQGEYNSRQSNVTLLVGIRSRW